MSTSHRPARLRDFLCDRRLRARGHVRAGRRRASRAL